MKKTIIIIAVLLSAAIAQADSLVSDPSPEHIGAAFEIWQAKKGLTDTQVVATGTTIVLKDMEPDGSVRYNLDSLPSGAFNWYIRAYGYAYIYGPNNTQGGSKSYSAFIPFDFTKRSFTGGVISGLRIAQ